MPVVIGVTGNIACGKSTVAKLLGELGAEVVDADEVVHELMAPGSEVWREIVAEFGHGILKPNAEIDRAALGAIVFSDPTALARLERIVHPAVIATVNGLIATSRAEVVAVEAVKLIESGMSRGYDSVWVVTCTREQQLARLRRERGLTREEAEARLQAQPSLEEKLRLADVVIDNSGSLEDTWRQVKAAWKRVIGRAPSRERKDEGAG